MIKTISASNINDLVFAMNMESKATGAKPLGTVIQSGSHMFYHLMEVPEKPTHMESGVVVLNRIKENIKIMDSYNDWSATYETARDDAIATIEELIKGYE